MTRRIGEGVTGSLAEIVALCAGVTLCCAAVVAAAPEGPSPSADSAGAAATTQASTTATTRPAASQPAGAQSTDTQPAAAERDELVRRLLGGESTSVDMLDVTLASMDEAARRLDRDRDTGRATQTAQRRVLEGLDTLIRQAGENRRATAQPSRVRQRGEHRQPRPRESQDQKPSPDARGGKAERGGPGASGQGDEDSQRQVKREKGELERGWGYLPGRERDEVIQGFDEEFLAKYREEIMRYYRNLATPGEPK